MSEGREGREVVAEYGFNGAPDELDWENFLEVFSEFCSRKNPEWNISIATVRNFGWRNLNGCKLIGENEPAKLLKEILPETECSFRIFETDYGFDLQNYHHDSPTGNEWYEVTFLTDTEKYRIMSELTGKPVEDLKQMVLDNDAEWVDSAEFHVYKDDSFYSDFERYFLIDYFK